MIWNIKMLEMLWMKVTNGLNKCLVKLKFTTTMKMKENRLRMNTEIKILKAGRKCWSREKRWETSSRRRSKRYSTKKGKRCKKKETNSKMQWKSREKWLRIKERIEEKEPNPITKNSFWKEMNSKIKDLLTLNSVTRK